MNEQELKKRIEASMVSQCCRRGYTAPVDVLIEIGVLTKRNYTEWRYGKVPYLEKVCMGNQKKMRLIIHLIQNCGRNHKYKESFTYYRQWASKTTELLQFSKYKDPNLEKAYATHYVDTERIKELKEKKAESGSGYQIKLGKFKLTRGQIWGLKEKEDNEFIGINLMKHCLFMCPDTLQF